MIRGFYSAGSGLFAQQTAMNNAANNIANANTTGFKKQSVDFSDLMYSNKRTFTGNAKIGNGTREASIDSVFTQGALDDTARELDFAITGKGFFGVMSANGEISFTRDGNFGISTEQNGNFLVSASGDYVLDQNGNKINVDRANLPAKIGVFSFDNVTGLERIGNNQYIQTATSGQATPIAGELTQGKLERANVELADEMSDLIAIQRSFQFNAKMIQTADEIENITNNLR